MFISKETKHIKPHKNSSSANEIVTVWKIKLIIFAKNRILNCLIYVGFISKS